MCPALRPVPSVSPFAQFAFTDQSAQRLYSGYWGEPHDRNGSMESIAPFSM